MRYRKHLPRTTEARQPKPEAPNTKEALRLHKHIVETLSEVDELLAEVMEKLDSIK